MTARWSARPDAGRGAADDALLELLARLQERLAGALAIVSGRPVADIDRLLAPLRLTVAGLHGLVRPRDAGRSRSGPADASAEPGARGAVRLRGRASRNSGRGQAFEPRPALPPGAGGGRGGERLAERWPRAARALRLQRGKMVVELLPAGRDKGRAIGDC